MLYFNPLKTITIILVSLASLFFATPNLLTKEQLANLPGWMQMRMGLGLDLQGGAYFLLELDTQDLRKNWLEALADDVRQSLRDEKVLFTSPTVAGNEVRVTIKRDDQIEKAIERLKKLSRSNFDVFSGAPDIEVTREGKIIKLKPTEAALNARITNAMGTAVEIFRNRIDPSGTREILIQRQGENRILLQVPGVSDAEAKAIWEDKINKPAVLTFQLVDQSMTVQEAQEGSPPPGSALYKGAANSDEEGQFFLLQKRILVSGADLVDAQQSFKQNTTEPVVSFRFNTSGSQRFAKVTRDNVGKPFAIVLDSEVISAPVIREPILGGSGEISGRYTVQTANDLAILLRSGALPAKPKLVARQTVGASMGADAIASGKTATLWAFALVALFMVIGYGLFGAFSIVALIVNIAIIIATMSLMGGTLTLPGIAGIALTMGVAVDANVLIYERMREELRSGKSNILALEAGFSRAYATIIDSHLTGLLGGVILMWLGSGPIRGFAITLSIGIVASLFTAITLTRLIIATWLRYTRPTVIPL